MMCLIGNRDFSERVMPSPFPLKYLVHEMPNKLWHGSFLIEDRLFIIDTIESPV